MELSSKIDLKDVLWWMSIKDAYRPRAPIIARLSKVGCISLVTRGRPSCATHKHVWSRCGPFLTWKKYSSKTGVLKIWNLDHKYKTTRAQLLRKIDGAQSSVERKHIPPKDIDSQTWHLTKGSWKDSHDP
jgi:hypothetical protein